MFLIMTLGTRRQSYIVVIISSINFWFVICMLFYVKMGILVMFLLLQTALKSKSLIRMIATYRRNQKMKSVDTAPP